MDGTGAGGSSGRDCVGGAEGELGGNLVKNTSEFVFIVAEVEIRVVESVEQRGGFLGEHLGLA